MISPPCNLWLNGPVEWSVLCIATLVHHAYEFADVCGSRLLLMTLLPVLSFCDAVGLDKLINISYATVIVANAAQLDMQKGR